MFRNIIARWNAPKGYREVLHIGLPLIVSMGSATVMQFTDRIFLGRYDLNAIAACMPASISNFLFMAFFMGVVSYVNVFVAQYTGSGKTNRVGSALWQGIYVSLLAGICMIFLALIAKPLFALAGHAPNVQIMEVSYFRVLCLGSGLNLVAVTLATFYSGRGLTRPVMLVNLVGMALNIPLDYALIFGLGPFPEMGIFGAGLATVISWGFCAALFAALVFSKDNERQFATRSSYRLDKDLFLRLLRFGLPSGAQFFIDIFAISFFVFIIGRLGTTELAATNIVFSLNHIAFLPMIGLHVAVETMVGQAVGGKRPEDGVRAAKSAVHLCFIYMAVVSLGFVLIGGPLMDLFQTRGLSAADYSPIRNTGIILLRIVALYSLFDAVAIIYFGALKGAGDTRFVMLLLVVASLLTLIIPTFLALVVFHSGIYTVWSFVAFYVLVLAGAALWRFKHGKWRSMRVIEG